MRGAVSGLAPPAPLSLKLGDSCWDGVLGLRSSPSRGAAFPPIPLLLPCSGDVCMVREGEAMGGGERAEQRTSLMC